MYKRLEQAGTTPLEDLFAHISTLLPTRLMPYAQHQLAPFATAVVALQETTVAHYLPAVADAPAQPLPSKLTALFDVRSQHFLALAYQAYPQQNEKVAAATAGATLAPGTLILADLGYLGCAWCDALTDQYGWWLSRLHAKTSYTVRHSCYQQDATFDGLVWLGVYRADRAKCAVRLVQYRVGPTLHQYITHVQDPHQLPLAAVAQVYARRWDSELACKLIKRDWGGGLVR